MKLHSIFEKVLVTLYNLEEGVSRRELATYIFIAEHFTNTRFIDVFDIYPDGVESTRVNLAVDTLIESELIYSDFGRLKLSRKGLKEAEDVLSTPEEKIARKFYRVVSYLKKLSHRTKLDLAGYIWLLEQNIIPEGFTRTKIIYEKMYNEFQTEIKRPIRAQIATL